MRVLFFIEPLVMHNRPFHYWVWLDYASTMSRSFAGWAEYEFRFVMNEALAVRALAPFEPKPRFRPRRGQGHSRQAVVTLAQEEIRGIFEGSNSAVLEGFHRAGWSGAQLDRYGGLLKERLSDFRPDVIVTWTPAPFLARAFPDALILGIECGPFSRAPYPLTLFFDPFGLWEHSVPGRFAEELKRRTATPGEAALLGRMRDHYRPFFEAGSPFHSLERRMRQRSKKLALLPLQFAGESGFDLNAPFRNQGEYLLHVLENLPEGLGLLVVEHPTARWIGDFIDDETREYLIQRYPQVAFVDFQTVESAGQYLVHHVDYVIGISTSLGWQTLFWSKPLVAIGRSQLRPYSAFPSVREIDLGVDPARLPSFEGALGWLFTRYYAPERYALVDPTWIDAFFRRCLEKRAVGVQGLDLLEEIAPCEDLATHLCAPLPERARRPPRPIEGLLENGAFRDWSEGNGPFRAPGVTCDRWELIPGAGNAAQASRGELSQEPDPKPAESGPFVRLERRGSSSSPVLLLQRISDVTRLAGVFATVRFWARSRTGEPLFVYFYQQFDTRRITPRGTEPRQFDPGPEWDRYEYEVVLPDLADGEPGSGSHTELVFGLHPGEEPGGVDLAGVEIQ